MKSGQKIRTAKPPSKSTWRGPRRFFKPPAKPPSSRKFVEERLPIEVWNQIIDYLAPVVPERIWFSEDSHVDAVREYDSGYEDPPPSLKQQAAAKQTLANLCLVSNVLAWIAMPHLYRKIFITSPRALQLLLRTLENPDCRHAGWIVQFFCSFATNVYEDE
jgi:hypothetical protein